MEEAVESGRGRWSAAVGLSFALLFLAVFDALALFLLPLAILIVGWPAERRAKWLVSGAVLWLLVLFLAGGQLAILSRGWALMLGALYLALTLARPEWSVISRSMGSVGIALLIGLFGLLVTGQGTELDSLIQNHFTTISTLTIGDLQERMPDAAWLANLRTATEQISKAQTQLFPALLALQSLVALALASWWIRRIGRSGSPAFELNRLRDFRFNDQLIWLLIAALVMLLLPAGTMMDRLAINLIFFMAALYAFRGLAIFVFLAAGSRSIPTMVFGATALVFLYPVAFTAALLMGLGDTWLDVRSRIASANPA